MAETKSTRAHHHGNLKEALLAYALTAAQSQTLDDLSLRKASRDLGVSPGAAYRHFPDKDTLMRSVAQRGFDALAAEFEAAVPFDTAATTPTEARARFHALGRAYVAFARNNYGLWRLMFGPFGRSPSEDIDRPSTYAWLGRVLVDLKQQDVIAKADAQAQYFAWTAIHGLSDLKASPAVPRTDDKDVTERQCDFILDALRQG